MWWWDDYWSPWMPFGPLVVVVFFALCFGMMFFMMRGMTHGSRGGSSLDILKERFARGEINQAEYEERRRALES